MNRIESIEGQVYLGREDPEGERCICCNGEPHIFMVGVDITPWQSRYGSYRKQLNDWISDFLSNRKLELDGKQVRVTIEVLED
jgi:hypothetical protein